MIPWTEQGTPWINKNLGSQPRRSFLTVLFSPLGRTASVVVPTGLTQTYGFEKKTWYHTKPIKIRPSMFDSYLNRWVWLCLSPLPKLPGAGTSYWSPQHRLLSLPAPGIINHYGPNMIDGGTLYINRLSSSLGKGVVFRSWWFFPSIFRQNEISVMMLDNTYNTMTISLAGTMIPQWHVLMSLMG